MLTSSNRYSDALVNTTFDINKSTTIGFVDIGGVIEQSTYALNDRSVCVNDRKREPQKQSQSDCVNNVGRGFSPPPRWHVRPEEAG